MKKWPKKNWGIIFFAILLGVALLDVLFIIRKPTVRYADKQIQYWDKELKDWQCFMPILDDRFVSQYQFEQYKCGQAGHKWAYKKAKPANDIWIGNSDDVPKHYFDDAYIFRCSKCDLEIKKSESELTATEKTALVNLGIIK